MCQDNIQFLATYWQAFHWLHTLQLWWLSCNSFTFFHFFLINNVLQTPVRKKSQEVKYGEWGSQGIGPHFLIQRSGNKSRDNSVSIVLGYELDDQGSRVWLPIGAGNFSLHHHVQNGSGAHPASYPMGTRGSFFGGKAAGAWSWPLTSI
jgi:hypothetical protein